jgi:hypothetical protein
VRLAGDGERDEFRGGAQPPKRRRVRVPPDDDRPRGFQPQRMRRLWNDIDQARDKLGLGRTSPASSAPPWSLAALLRCAAELPTSATGFIWDLACAVPATVHTVLGVVPWLRQAPIVGRLIALLPDPPAGGANPRERR